MLICVVLICTCDDVQFFNIVMFLNYNKNKIKNSTDHVFGSVSRDSVLITGAFDFKQRCI